jgi:hypothetical protein
VHIDTAPVRAVVNDLEGDLVDASAEAREAMTRSVEDGRELLIARSADLRDAFGDRAAVWGELAKDRAADLSGDLEQRAGEWRDVVRTRARALEKDLPVDTDDAWAYAQMGGWQLVRGLIALVAFIPRLIVRVLGGLSRVVDQLAGVDVRARGRELAAAVPLPAGSRKPSRRRTVLLLALGAVIGFVGGVAASRRRAPIVTYDVPPRAPQDAVAPREVTPLADVVTPDDNEVPDGEVADGDDGSADGA